MSNIIDTIRVSGTDYTLSATSSGGNPTVELTQAEYDALVSAGTVSANTYYIITDAPAIDMSQYWTSAQTQSAITSAVSGKQDTLVSGTNIKTINNESILGSGNINIQGGGKAIEAGRGISITTGETADTVSFNLPISAGTGTNSIRINDTSVKASGTNSFAGGSYSDAKSYFSIAFGRYAITKNYGEAAFGFYNKTNGSSSQVGNNSGCTLFSVGNGTAVNGGEHNAFEIRQNGDIYFNDGASDVKLQDKFSTIETTIGDINTILQSI